MNLKIGDGTKRWYLSNDQRKTLCRADCRLVPSQWETSLSSNAGCKPRISPAIIKWHDIPLFRPALQWFSSTVVNVDILIIILTNFASFSNFNWCDPSSINGFGLIICANKFPFLEVLLWKFQVRLFDKWLASVIHTFFKCPLPT